MPEFQIDLGLDYDRWNGLDSFVRSYVEAIFWLHDENDNVTFADFSDEAMQKAIEDCRAFNHAADAWLHKAYTRGDMSYAESTAAVDFWLTRNGHGAGFWDRGLGCAGYKLSEIARGFGSCDSYLGDDGKVYLS